MARADVLIVSLGGTAGLREADAELAASLRRAGAWVEVATTARPPELRTFAAIELAWALNARRAAILAIRDMAPADKAIWRDLFDHYVFRNDGQETDHIPPPARGILAPLTSESAGRLRAFLLRTLSR